MQIIATILAIIFGLWFLAILVVGLKFLWVSRKFKVAKNKQQIEEIIKCKKIESVMPETELANQEAKFKDGVKRITTKISEFKNNSNNIPLMVVGSLMGYEIQEIIGPDSKFEEKFVEGAQKILGYKEFESITNGKISAHEYLRTFSSGIPNYYKLVVDEYIDRYGFFLDNFNKFHEFIEKNHQLLTAKKRTLLIPDEFGDVDGSEWINFLQRFAERRELVNPHQSIANEFEAVREYLKLIGLEDFQGKVLSYLLALYDHFNKKDDEFSNIYTGVDFERHLKKNLEDTLPDVYVETTPASGDHGADLLVRYKGIVIAIQAKYYTGTVGNAAVQEIHSGMGFYDANYGMVVTQSKYTEHARSLANKLGIYLENTDSYIEKIKELAN